MLEASIIDRKVVLPNVKLYKADSNSLSIKFTTDKTYNGVDLSTCDIFVKFLRVDGQSDKVKLTGEVIGEELSFIYTPTIIETFYEGALQVQISFEKNAENFVLNTEIFVLEIYDSITGYEGVYLTPYDTGLVSEFVRKENFERVTGGLVTSEDFNEVTSGLVTREDFNEVTSGLVTMEDFSEAISGLVTNENFEAVTSEFVREDDIDSYIKPQIETKSASAVLEDLVVLPNTLTNITGEFINNNLSISLNKSDWILGDLAQVFFTMDGGLFSILEGEDKMEVILNGVSVKSGVFTPTIKTRYEMILYCTGDKISITFLEA